MTNIQPRAQWLTILGLLWTGMVYGVEISGPSEIKAGEILVLTANLEPGARHRWILPADIEALGRTGNQIAIVVDEIGPLQIILVEVTAKAINVARFECLIMESTSSQAAPPEPRPVDLTSQPRPPPMLVVMHSMSPCPACDKWRADELPGLSSEWQFSEVKNSVSVSVFPSFEIHAHGRQRYFEGYLSAAQIKTEITSMESER